MLSEYQDGERENLGYQLLENKQLSTGGLILIGVPNRTSSLLQRALAEEVPVVVLSRVWPEIPVSTVGQDHVKATEKAMNYLFGLGHRKIGFVASDVDRHFHWFAPRLRKYQEMMTLRGEADDDLIAVGDDIREAVRALTDRRSDVTAIFAIHDEIAVETMAILREIGLRIPQDISVIGLDDSINPPDHLPSLTTVGFPHRKVGRLAAELLLQQIEDDCLYYSKIFVRSCLIERDSCGRPRS